MKQRPRTLSDQDRAIWAGYVRQIRVLAGRELPPMPPVLPSLPQPSQPSQPSQPRILVLREKAPPLVTGMQPAGLDKASWHRFRGGKLAPARTLDLHGKTAQAAYHALERFLHAAHADRLRCVEVITGRGSGEAGGVIRRELPLWLNLPGLRPLVLATAHPHAVNPGSTRILLRRERHAGGSGG